MKAGKHLINARFLAFAEMATMQEAEPEPGIYSFAFVQQDGALKIAGELIRLFGIDIVPTDPSCNTFVRPLPCGIRASLAQQFKISGDFVQCTARATNPEGSITASGSAGNEDLSAYRLQRGWAVALPDAPFTESAMQRIASSRGIGIRETPVDLIRRRR